MKKKTKTSFYLSTSLLVAVALAFLVLIFPQSLWAADSLSVLGEASGLNTTTTLPIMVAQIIQVFLGVLGLVAVIIIIYAGYLYVTAQGEMVNVEKAKKILKNAGIGFVIIFSSFSITTFVLGKLLEAVGLSSGVTTTSTNFSEPLSASLGSGIIDSHYPARNATEVPRNTSIMITFKEAIDLDSIITGYGDAVAAGASTFDLNVDNILIYPTDAVSDDVPAESVALGSTEVGVIFVTPFEAGELGPRTFVFYPPLLGSSTSDTDYTVKLKPGIKKADLRDAFTGSYEDGYEWSFEVSTEIDLTPPEVVSVIPAEPIGSEKEARNVVVSLTFNEAMDPVMASGVYGSGKTFDNIKVLSGEVGDQDIVAGAFKISNAYRTVEFVTDDLCGEDPCGDEIYCLPGSESIEVLARAASVGVDAPQASALDGLMDAAGNSLNGDNSDAVAKGSPADDYAWNFSTSADINWTVPYITGLVPGPKEGDVDVNKDVAITFSIPMQSATLVTSNIQLVPDHTQEFWYSNTNTSTVSNTTVTIDHATFWEKIIDTKTGNPIQYFYYPVITNDVKSNWQICMLPANGPAESGVASNCGDSTEPYCCNGKKSDNPCVTINGTSLGQ